MKSPATVTLFVIILSVWVSLSGFAQSRRIDGTLTTDDGSPVPFASVMVINQAQHILAFKATDSRGNFSLTWQDTVHTGELRLEINHLGYKKVSIPLVPGQQRYDIRMEEQPIDLAEVEVKSRPVINLRGDTLSYDVATFTKAEDRSIGDILKRLPGVEVEENGQIKYNGKPISNFYVDGDDLLNDKYAIGTQTIPHAMVKDVEIMQNHQPLKVLQGKAISEEVALNLKIRDEARLQLTGQAKPGGGLPEQYDGELNTVLFNKKYKMLNVAKANNVGTDLSADLTGFSQADRLSRLGNSHPSELLTSRTVGNPSLPTNRYYFNNSGSLNANNLANLKNGLQLKSNVGLMIDNREMDYYSTHTLFLPNDTIQYSEIQQSGQQPFLINVSLNAQVNKEAYYFHDALKIDYSGEKGISSLLSNGADVSQQLRSRVHDFSNYLEYIPALGNQNILTFNWYLNHFNRPQTLDIKPGILADVLNEGEPFDAVYQHTETPTWFNTVSIGYRIPEGKIMQHYQLSALNEWKQLYSELRLAQPGGQVTHAENSDNLLHWERHNAQFSAAYELNTNRWEALLSLPLTWQYVGYDDAHFNLSETDRQLLFNPLFRLKYLTTPEDYLAISYSYNNQVGSINDLYRGVILTNYRTLRTNEGPLQEKRTHSAGLSYHFQRTISMLFMNAGINFSRSRYNTIASNRVQNDVVTTALLPFDNLVNTFSANAGISKYIFALGATAALNGTWNTTRFEQLMNDELLPYRNLSFSITPSIEARLWDQISLGYEGTGRWTASKLIPGKTGIRTPDRRITQYDQSVNLLYSPFTNTFLRLSGRHQYTRQPGMADIRYFFADASARYKIDKWDTDIELSVTNLANIRSYETYSLSANESSYSRYNLRGRMALVKLTFNL